MKRFYERAMAEPSGAHFQILLDGKPVKTPARATLALPTRNLADAVVEEWQRQGEVIAPRTMPLTGLANAAIDRIGPDHEAFVRGLAVFGESDLLCYRADAPPGLVTRQAAAWDPVLDWARRRFEVEFEIVTGIMHRSQPEETVERLRQAIESRDPFRLAALSPLVTISGSLVIALALAEGGIDLESAWTAATVDEDWQIEQWGEDAEASARLAARRAEFDAAFRFLTLLSD